MLFSDGIDVSTCCTVCKLDVAETLPVATVVDEDVVRFDIYAGSAMSEPVAKVLLFYRLV